MAYNKKNKSPSIKTPGVYRDATDKQLGLDNDDLENLSLGNWNSLFSTPVHFSTIISTPVYF